MNLMNILIMRVNWWEWSLFELLVWLFNIDIIHQLYAVACWHDPIYSDITEWSEFTFPHYSLLIRSHIPWHHRVVWVHVPTLQLVDKVRHTMTSQSCPSSRSHTTACWYGPTYHDITELYEFTLPHQVSTLKLGIWWKGRRQRANNNVGHGS